jgi:hypothetical protein
MDGLCPDAKRRYLIREHGAYRGIVGTGEEFEQTATGVKIVLQMSHNTLTTVEEYVQRRNIA